MRALLIKTSNLQFDKLVKRLGDRLKIDADAVLVSCKKSYFTGNETYKFAVTFEKIGSHLGVEERASEESKFISLLEGAK